MSGNGIRLLLARPSRALVAAGVACVAAGVFCLSEAVQAARIDPLPKALPQRTTAAASRAVAPATTHDGALTQVVERNVFRPDRRRGTVRFQLPRQILAAPPMMPAPPGMGMVRLVGIASTGANRGIAAVSVLGRAPQLLRVGESLEGWRLTHVRSGSISLSGRDTVMTLQMPPRSP